MVIKKCKDGETKIDWIKSLAVIAVFSGVILYCLKLSTEANAMSVKTATVQETMQQDISEIKHGVEKLVDMHTVGK